MNAQGQVIASGIAGGDAVSAPAGNHTVRLKGRTDARQTGGGEAKGDGEHRVLRMRDTRPGYLSTSVSFAQPGL